MITVSTLPPPTPSTLLELRESGKKSLPILFVTMNKGAYHHPNATLVRVVRDFPFRSFVSA